MPKRTKTLLRAMGREDFEQSQGECATDGHALAATVLHAAQRNDLTDAEFGVFVRGAVARYFDATAEQEDDDA